MGIFDLFRRKDINEGLVQFKNTNGAILVDVREKDEYRSGHIPGSKNIPLSTLSIIEKQVKESKDAKPIDNNGTIIPEEQPIINSIKVVK